MSISNIQPTKICIYVSRRIPILGGWKSHNIMRGIGQGVQCVIDLQTRGHPAGYRPGSTHGKDMQTTVFFRRLPAHLSFIRTADDPQVYSANCQQPYPPNCHTTGRPPVVYPQTASGPRSLHPLTIGSLTRGGSRSTVVHAAQSLRRPPPQRPAPLNGPHANGRRQQPPA